MVLLWPAGDRHQDRKFKEWLTHCHATLDKSVAFEVLADAAVQVCAACTEPTYQCLARLACWLMLQVNNWVQGGIQSCGLTTAINQVWLQFIISCRLGICNKAAIHVHGSPAYLLGNESGVVHSTPTFQLQG